MCVCADFKDCVPYRFRWYRTFGILDQTTILWHVAEIFQACDWLLVLVWACLLSDSTATNIASALTRLISAYYWLRA